jgi:hypothetical protein
MWMNGVVPVKKNKPFTMTLKLRKTADIRASELPCEEARLSKSFFWESS